MTKRLVLCFLATLHLLAQKDTAGEWDNRFDEDFLERIPGSDIGDYLGIPINAAARLHGDSWDASLLTLPEHQCKPHPSDYGIRGPALRVWKEVDTSGATPKIPWHPIHAHNHTAANIKLASVGLREALPGFTRSATWSITKWRQR